MTLGAYAYIGKFRKFKCEKCTPEQSVARGCEDEAEIPIIRVEQEYLKRCPISLITPATMTTLNAYHFYRARGILPVAGGYMDQAATIMDAFMHIDNVIAKEDAKTQAEDKKNWQNMIGKKGRG